jgi:succinate-semialdehyde dehydrogenase/glutarate-semialdehyde dehydrogenase
MQKQITGWAEYSIDNRIMLLKQLLNDFNQNKEVIASTITLEIGKPISQSRSEVDFFNSFNKWTLDNAENILAEKVIYEDNQSLHTLCYEAIGKAALILPWNSPYGLLSWKLFSNLVVGNTVMIKHSELCPNTSKLIEEIIHKIEFPANTVEFVYGADDVGKEIVQSEIDMICFTGSSETGKKIYDYPKKKFPKLIMELGGSNAAIVFEDANLKMVVDKIFNSRFANNGQNCDAIKRVLLPENMFGEFVSQMVLKLSNCKIGDPSLSDTYFGPLASKKQLEVAKSQLDDSIWKNHVSISFKLDIDPNLKGNYFSPVIVQLHDLQSRVWNEETFAPILPIVAYKDEHEAVEFANSTKYGLGTVIFTEDQDRIKRIVPQLKSGNIEINNASQWIPQVPFGGYKFSGIGRENGVEGLLELCQIKVVSR